MLKKRICLVIPSLYPGGMERVMSELANYFCKKPNIDVHIILYGIKPEIFYMLPEQINIHKQASQFDNHFRFWTTIKTMVYLRREIKKIKPDSVLSFGEYWNSFVLLATYGMKLPIYVSDRCQPDKSLGKTHDLLRKILYRKATGIIIQTEIAKKIYQKFLPEKRLYVIGNPIREIANEGVIPKQNIVLSVGRLIISKHHDELIKLFVRIGMPDWKLVIVGDDAIKQQNKVKLHELIQKLNAGDKIILTGTRNDVEQFYIKSKIFAFTSSSEGFPNVLGEAMSVGLPVVAFDCIAGPSELINDGENGYLIPLFDYLNFEKKLKTLMEDEKLRIRLGKEAQKITKKFAVDVVGEQYLNFMLNNE